jgi:hypothetical protein
MLNSYTTKNVRKKRSMQRKAIKRLSKKTVKVIKRKEITMSGEDKKKIIFRVKTAVAVVVVLLAIFGAQQIFRPHAQANYTDTFMQGEYKARRDLSTFLLPEKSDHYAKECSSCHFLYNPGLLSSESWEKLIKKSSNHFGTDLKLTDETKKEFILYLTDSSTDKGIMSATDEIILGLRDKSGEIPLRVTQTRYIKDAHKGIDPEVFTRDSVGSFSNCGACHTRP